MITLISTADGRTSVAPSYPGGGFEEAATNSFSDLRALSYDEQLDAGRGLRASVPRRSHAEWDPATATRDPVALLERSNTTRLADLVPVRYGRMLDSEFSYLRGSPIVMAADLATTPTTGVAVQASGDAHLLNFGLYGTPERQVVFDLNDFDETHLGPWEWDLKRLAVSLRVTATTLGMGGACGHDAARAGAEAYRSAMRKLAAMPALEVWYSHVSGDTIAELARNRSTRQWIERTIAQARARDNRHAFAHLTTTIDGRVQIVEDPPITVRVPDNDDVMPALRELFDGYLSTLEPHCRDLVMKYDFVDAARRVVGVGSVGTRCYVLLGASHIHGGPLFLQIKEAEASVLEPHCPPTPLANQGERVVRGQRLLQSVSDILLGWSHVHGRDFYVRQLRDMKGGLDVKGLTPERLVAYGALCGYTLARAHARNGPVGVIAGYLGSSMVFDEAIAMFADAYAAQNHRDFEALVEAERTGRVTRANRY